MRPEGIVVAKSLLFYVSCPILPKQNPQQSGALMKTFIPAILVFSLVAPALAQAPKAKPTEKKDECTVAGMVVKLADSEPLRKARVYLRSADDRTRSISVVTDSGGRFQFKGIDPGRYNLSVNRVGFVPQGYGQKKPDDPGALLTLRPGQEVKDLLFRLIPSAVIAGKILDEDGEPLPEIIVSMHCGKESIRKASPAFPSKPPYKRTTAVSTVCSGCRPAVISLAPFSPNGVVFRAAMSQKKRNPISRVTQRCTTRALQTPRRLPSSRSRKVERSRPLRSSCGSPSRCFRIRGHVYNQITNKTGTQTNIFLMPKAKSREWTGDEHQTFVQKRDGSFEIADVLPGSYVLNAMWSYEGKHHIAALRSHRCRQCGR